MKRFIFILLTALALTSCSENQMIDLSVVLVYFTVLMIVSWLTSRKHKDNKAFFSGSHKSPWYAVAFGMIGASLSGVTFISVPGMVSSSGMTYLQTCMGFFVGYIVISYVLLPLYYKLNVVSIYSYLDQRFGSCSYLSGSLFFFVSKLLGAAARLYVVCIILQNFVFQNIGLPFPLTVILIVTLIWLYTKRGGIRTIIWTDCLQTLCLLTALVLMIIQVSSILGLDFREMVQTILVSPNSRVFVFDDWMSKQNFFKQFFSGIFITIVMTGLDQDMMQKNLSCRNLREARKNMMSYGFAFIPVNLLFLSLGVLLLMILPQYGLSIPSKGDDLLPMLASGGYLGRVSIAVFTIGIVSAAFSSADSALTALTTTFSIDILKIGRFQQSKRERYRKITHFSIALAFVICIIAFNYFENSSILDTIYVLASYTYGPLLGMFAFGIFTKRQARDKIVPIVGVLSPIICYMISEIVSSRTGYVFGYELLMLNGLITFVGVFLTSFTLSKTSCSER